MSSVLKIKISISSEPFLGIRISDFTGRYGYAEIRFVYDLMSMEFRRYVTVV